jgi:hypothetical protein
MVNYEILGEPDSTALETLLRESQRAQAALAAMIVRVQGTAEVKRLAPGVWAVLSAPESAEEPGA